jgi:hypothetical protein
MKTIADILTEHGVTFDVRFVPQRLSRNAKDKQPSLNWLVTLRRGDRVVSVPYTQGIGHHPRYRFADRSVAHRDEMRKSAEDGLVSGVRSEYRSPIDKPEPIEVLACLISDIPCEDRFEDWADALGYDSDSIKARNIYRACVKTGEDMDLLFGRSGIEDLRTATEDY